MVKNLKIHVNKNGNTKGDKKLEFAISINNINSTVCAKPFVKWAGGKGQLLDTFRQYYPSTLIKGYIRRYIEPFVGGGAVYLKFCRNIKLRKLLY